MRIHNTLTNLVGRTRNERIVSQKEWRTFIFPLIERLLKPSAKSHKALIGHWVVEYLGNDEHMYEFFSRNWKKAPPHACVHVRSYVLNHVTDPQAMRILRGVQVEADLEKLLTNLLKDFENPTYRNAFKDPRLREIEKFSREEQLEIALFAPSTIYCSQETAFVSINTNYYGQLKSKSSLGPLEEILTRKACLNESRQIENPADVWLSMHAGAVEYTPQNGEKKGIVMIAPTGTGKSTQGYGLVEAKPQNKLHSDDWLFVNLETREVLASEEQFYMRTNIAEIYPHLIPLLVNQPLENVTFTEDIVRKIESFISGEDFQRAVEEGRLSAEDYSKIAAPMIENKDARSLIDPRMMVGEEKFVERIQITNLFLLKRDFDDCLVLKNLTPREMEIILTSKNNVYNHVYGERDWDGYGIPTDRTTEIYYNPYLCVVEVDRENEKIGFLDQIRIAAYKFLARLPQVTVSWINTRLPAGQTQLCIRKFLEGGIDEIRVLKGAEISENLLQRLQLRKKLKPSLEGRRKMDEIGLYERTEQEVEVVGFFERGLLIEALALLKSGKAANQLRSYTGGSPEVFLIRNEEIQPRQLLRHL